MDNEQSASENSPSDKDAGQDPLETSETTSPDGNSSPDAEQQPEPLSIRLDHFLQICGVGTGGQAKQLIQSGLVKLNGEVETRRRKKLAPGDVVSIDGEEFEVTQD